MALIGIEVYYYDEESVIDFADTVTAQDSIEDIRRAFKAQTLSQIQQKQQQPLGFRISPAA